MPRRCLRWCLRALAGHWYERPAAEYICRRCGAVNTTGWEDWRAGALDLAEQLRRLGHEDEAKAATAGTEAWLRDFCSGSANALREARDMVIDLVCRIDPPRYGERMPGDDPRRTPWDGEPR